MRALRRLFSRLYCSVTRQRDEERLREELEGHLALQVAENVRAGMSREEARRQAVLEFGPIEAIKDGCRDEQTLPLMDDVQQDVHCSLLHHYAQLALDQAQLLTDQH